LEQLKLKTLDLQSLIVISIRTCRIMLSESRDLFNFEVLFHVFRMRKATQVSASTDITGALQHQVWRLTWLNTLSAGVTCILAIMSWQTGHSTGIHRQLSQCFCINNRHSTSIYHVHPLIWRHVI